MISILFIFLTLAQRGLAADPAPVFKGESFNGDNFNYEPNDSTRQLNNNERIQENPDAISTDIDIDKAIIHEKPPMDLDKLKNVKEKKENSFDSSQEPASGDAQKIFEQLNKENYTQRVIGGRPVDISLVPYQVSLRDNNGHFCGGSIISQTLVLTAAHCVDGIQAAQFVVVTGTSYLSKGGVSYRVSRIIIHQNWNRTQFTFDIALLRLSSPIKYNKNTNFISLDNKGLPDDVQVWLTGWGKNSWPGNYPDELQYIGPYSVNWEKCKKALYRSNYGPFINFAVVCTFGKKISGCVGDSGGPLVYKGVQVGIVSWGIPCGKGYPDAYTRVSSYIGWISAQAKGYKDD